MQYEFTRVPMNEKKQEVSNGKQNLFPLVYKNNFIRISRSEIKNKSSSFIFHYSLYL